MKSKVGAVISEYVIALVILGLAVSAGLYLFQKSAEERSKISVEVVTTTAPCDDPSSGLGWTCN